jgi:hypothetical protein
MHAMERRSRVQGLGLRAFDAASLLVNWASLTHSGKLQGAGRVAVLAALAASLADYLLLVGERWGDPAWIASGYSLGVCSLPLLALGYWQVREALKEASPRLAAIVLFAGVLATASATALHGMSAVLAATGQRVVSDRLAVLDPARDLLAPLWLLLAVALFVVSLAFATAVIFMPSVYPRLAALAAPALVIPAIATAGLLVEGWSWFLVPAAPILGQLVFFVVSTILLLLNDPAH